MSTAAATGEPLLKDLVEDALMERFPVHRGE
jgi:hypothetical protein